MAVSVFFQPHGIEEVPIVSEVKATSTPKSAKLLPELVPICACESTGDRNGTPTHFDKDGSVLRGRINSADVGICQINLTYHKKEADALGLDLFREEDNIEYANRLFRVQGSKPWFWSQGCWATPSSSGGRVQKPSGKQ